MKKAVFQYTGGVKGLLLLSHSPKRQRDSSFLATAKRPPVHQRISQEVLSKLFIMFYGMIVIFSHCHAVHAKPIIK